MIWQGEAWPASEWDECEGIWRGEDWEGWEWDRLLEVWWPVWL